MLDLTLRPNMAKVTNVRLSNFGAFIVCSKSERPHVAQWHYWVRERDTEMIRKTWRTVRRIRPYMVHPLRDVTAQHYIVKHRLWTKRVGLPKDEYTPLLWRIPKNKYVYTESYIRKTDVFDEDLGECAFWMKIFMGFDFAKQSCLDWWWPAIVPDEPGFANVDEEAWAKEGFNKRQVSFVFNSETDAIVFTAFMDSL